MARFFNRGNALRPVHRIKHVIDIQNATTAGTNVTETIVTTVDAPVLANTDEVETGSKINGIFIVVEVSRTGTTSDVLANVYFAIWKNPGGTIGFPASNLIGTFDNKRFCMHQEMVMLQGTNASNPRTLFKGVVVLPRGYRRNGPNDLIQIRLLSPGVAINYCIQAHYKEFR